jgi:hypothetical protein
MINVLWCNYDSIQELKSFCSPNLDYLTIKWRPYYLPRSFLSIIATTVYTPPPPPSGYHGGPQRTSLDFMQTENHIS